MHEKDLENGRLFFFNFFLWDVFPFFFTQCFLYSLKNLSLGAKLQRYIIYAFLIKFNLILRKKKDGSIKQSRIE